jgi:hypothetical protein
MQVPSHTPLLIAKVLDMLGENEEHTSLLACTSRTKFGSLPSGTLCAHI